MSLNTSISDSTFSRLNLIKGLAKKMIRRVDLYLAQSQLTVDRLKLLDAKKIFYAFFPDVNNLSTIQTRTINSKNLLLSIYDNYFWIAMT